MITEQNTEPELQRIDADDDIVVGATAGAENQLAEGFYSVEFIKFELGPEFEDRQKPGTYNKTVRLYFSVTDGEYADWLVDGLCTLKGGPKAKLRRWAEVLRGQAYAPGENIRLSELLGKRVRALVTVNDAGYAKIDKEDALKPLPAPRAQQRVAAPVQAAATVPAPARPMRPARPEPPF